MGAFIQTLAKSLASPAKTALQQGLAKSTTSLNFNAGLLNASKFGQQYAQDRMKLGIPDQQKVKNATASFKGGTPIQQMNYPTGGFLGVGTEREEEVQAPTGKQKIPKTYPPTGEYTTSHDQLYGAKGLKPPSQIKEELALPHFNAANAIYRVKFPPGGNHYMGTAGPQGPSHAGSDTSVFPTDQPGGGTQVVTAPKDVEYERVMTGGQKAPDGSPLHTRAYEDVG